MKHLVLLISAIFIASCSQLNSEPNQQVKPLTVEVTQVDKIVVNKNFNIPAIIRAKHRADLSFQLSGTINQVLVKLGDEVEADQPLISLYNPNLDPTLAANLAQLESIKAQISQAKRDVKSLKALRQNNSTSRNALEHKETELKNYLAQEKSISAQIDQAKANQSESIITAPFTGVISMISKELGEFVRAGDPVLTLQQPSIWETEINLTMDLWNEVEVGQKIQVSNLLGSDLFVVSEKARSANSRSQLYAVILESETSVNLNSGDAVDVQVSKSFDQVYQLPLESIVDDGINQPYLFQVDQGIAHKVQIQPLFIQGGMLVFRSEIDITFPIVVKGQAKINDGSQVQINAETKVASTES